MVMKRKLLSLLLCTAFVSGIAPSAALAEETFAASGAKFGIKRGDIVHYAGSDSSISWRVIDADKTNVGTDGIWLLSNNTAVFAKQSINTSASLLPYYMQFYNKYFGDYYGSAVMPVTKTDAAHNSKYGHLYGYLNDATVFALSIDEAESLTDEERKFSLPSGNVAWWLRTAKDWTPPSDMAIYSYVDQDGIISYTPSESTLSDMRPSVNLDKTKLGGLDGSPLLLPAGEFAAANNAFAPVGEAGEYKLSQKADNVTLTACNMSDNENSVRINVNTNLTAPGDNDYISAVIAGEDGSISSYARYKLTSAEMTVSADLPGGIDPAKDSLYVFYENYKGALSGAVGELVRVCLRHDLEYSELDDSGHITQCKNCGYAVIKNHDITYFANDEESHGKKCEKCGYSVDKEKHRFNLPDLFDEHYHTKTCSECGYILKTAHDYTFSEINDSKHRAVCSTCCYETNLDHRFTCSDNGDGTHKAVCSDCTYTVENEEHIFSQNFRNQHVLTDFTCSLCGAKGFSGQLDQITDPSAAVLRDVYLAGSAKLTEGSSAFEAERMFENGTIYTAAVDSNTHKASVTFRTIRPVRTTGFKFYVPNMDYTDLPSSISLFGRNSDEEEYKYIGSGNVQQFIKRNAQKGRAYSFLFNDIGSFAQYSDYRLDICNSSGTNVSLRNLALYSLSGESSVEFDLNTVTAGDKDELAYPGEDYRCTLNAPIINHPSKKNVKVLSDGVQMPDNQWSYSEETGLLTIFGYYIASGKKYRIVSSPDGEIAKISADMSDGLTFNSDEYAALNKEYTCEFLDHNGKKQFIPTDMSDIAVAVGENDITGSCYLDENYTLHIPGEYVTGDITISAREAGLSKKDSSVVRVYIDGSTRWYDSIDKVSRLNEFGGDMTITLLSNISAAGKGLVLQNGKTTLDLDGYYIDAANDDVLHVGSDADVTVKNGNLKSSSSQPVLVQGTLTLENVFVSYGYFPALGITADGGKVIVNGSGSTIGGIALKNGGYAEIHDGTVNDINVNSGCNAKLLGGSVNKVFVEDGSLRLFDMLADDFSFTTEFSIDDYMIDGAGMYPIFKLNKTNTVFSVQPQDKAVEFKSDETLFADAGDGAKYRWFENGSLIGSEKELPLSSLSIGKHYIYCIAQAQDNTVARSNTAKITVTCSHPIVNADGICTGCGSAMTISAVCGGETKFFDSLPSAAAYANENADTEIKLLDNIQLADDALNANHELIFSGKNTVLDLNGKTVTADNADSTILVTGTLLIKGENGTVNINIAQDYSNGGTVTIESGTFAGIVGSSGGVVLNGGKFENISAVLDGCGDLLGKNKAFKKLYDGTFDRMYEIFSSVYNVEIADIPFKITRAPQSKYYETAPENENISLDVEILPEYEDQITYQWYVTDELEYSASDDSYSPLNGWSKAENVNTSSLKLPSDLSGGENRIYTCYVNCNGYSIYTDFAAFTFGKGTPSYLSTDSGFTLYAHGNDCTVTMASYSGKTLKDVKTVTLSADEGVMGISPQKLGLNAENATKVKTFVWDGFDTMTPFMKAPQSPFAKKVDVIVDDSGITAESHDGACVLMLADYKDNTLISTKIVNLNADNEYRIEKSFWQLDFEPTGTVKVFVWDSLKNMYPCDVNFQ